MPNFAPPKANRKVAQLVAHYVRDVGVGRSSRLFPTREVLRMEDFSLFMGRSVLSQRPPLSDVRKQQITSLLLFFWTSLIFNARL